MKLFFRWLKSEFTAVFYRLLYRASIKASFPRAAGSEQILFIMGSGSSVDDLTHEHWDLISDHTSIGINFWTIHSFTPSFYALEKSRATRVQPLEVLINNASRLEGTRVLWFGGPNRVNRKLLRQFKQLGGKVWFYSAFPLSGAENEKGHDVVALLARLFQFIPAFTRPAIDGGNTVTRLVTLAAMNGWKSIVLVGVDLGGPYFEQHSAFSEELYSYADRVSNTAGGLKKRHRGDSTGLGGLRLSATLPRLDSSFGKIGLGRVLDGNVNAGRILMVEKFDWPVQNSE